MTGPGLKHLQRIHTKSYKSAESETKSKLKHLQRIQLTMKLTKSTYSDDRAAYYQRPWEINKSGVSVAKGNLVAFNKTEIVPELVRQVKYFFDHAIQLFYVRLLYSQQIY